MTKRERFFSAVAGLLCVLVSADVNAALSPPPKEGTWEALTVTECIGTRAGSYEALKSAVQGCASEALNRIYGQDGRFTYDEFYTYGVESCEAQEGAVCRKARFYMHFLEFNVELGKHLGGTRSISVTAEWVPVCPDGSAPDPVTGECPEKCTEEQGLPRYVYPHHKPGQSQPAYCYQGCVYTKVGYAVCSSFGDDPIDSCTSKAMLMENHECTGGDYEPAAPDNCAIMKGKVVCMDQPKNNCSIIGNEAVCPGTAAPDRCTILGDGGMLCYQDAPNQPTTPDGSEQAEPDGQIITNNGDVLNYYSSETVNNSGTPTYGDWTGGDGGGGDGDGDGLEGVAQEDTLQGVLDALTPGDGDEVGTDAGVIAEWLGETGIGDVEAAVQREESIPGLSSSFLPVLPAGGACQKVSGTALGMSFEFPSNTGCVYLGYFREILAWALYILTIVYIWSIVMRRKED